MWKPIYQPEPWPQYLKRKDNVGVPLMEVRKKYMEEQILFENYVSNIQQLNTMNTLSPNMGGGGGPLPGSGDSPRSDKYQLVEGGSKVYHWTSFEATADRFGNTLSAGIRAGTLFETTTLFNAPDYPGYTPQEGYPLFSDNVGGTTVFKLGRQADVGEGDWSTFGGLPIAYFYMLPTDLGYVDWDYESFKPFTTLNHYRPYTAEQEDDFLPLAQYAGYTFLDRTSSSVVVGPAVAIITENLPAGHVFLSVDWTKVFRQDVKVDQPQITLAPGSTIPSAFDGTVLTSSESENLFLGSGLDDVLAYFGTNGAGTNCILVYTGGSWVFYDFGTFTQYPGPSSFDDIWKGVDNGDGEWAPGQITRVGVKL